MAVSKGFRAAVAAAAMVAALGQAQASMAVVTLPGSSAANPLLPSETRANGAFSFTFDVEQGQHVFIDPVVAIGYDYEVVAGDNFASVTLPAGIGDGLYDLYRFDFFSQDWALWRADVQGGTPFDLSNMGDGTRRFRVLGIETDAALDPSDPAAFVTDLTFLWGGTKTVTQTPITAEVGTAVPEPAGWALAGLGLGALGLSRRRRTAR